MDPNQVVRDPDGVMRCSQCDFRYNLSPSEIVDATARGLDAVLTALAGTPPDRRATRPAPDVWSVNAYTFHLGEAAEVITGRVQRIAAEDRPELTYYDQDVSIEDAQADSIPADESLQTLVRIVPVYIETIEGLPPDAWERTGVHERAGEVRLSEIAHDMPHELRHHAQDIARIGQG